MALYFYGAHNDIPSLSISSYQQVSSLCDDLGRGVANYKITGAKTTKPRVLKMSAELTPHSLLEGRTDYLPANVRYTREEEILSVEKTSTSQDTVWLVGVPGSLMIPGEAVALIQIGGGYIFKKMLTLQ